jgi:hypothetical protein
VPETLRAPEAERRIVKRRPSSSKGSAVWAHGVEGPKGSSVDCKATSAAPAASKKAASASRVWVSCRLNPLERSLPGKGHSRRMDDRHVTHHEPRREDKHDVPPEPGPEGRGNTQIGRGSQGQKRGPDRQAAPGQPPGPVQGCRG